MRQGYCRRSKICRECGQAPKAYCSALCKRCKAKSHLDWYRANPEKNKMYAERRQSRINASPELRAIKNEKQRAKYAQNKSQRQRRRRIYKFKISPQYHDSALRVQQGKCDICGLTESQDNKFLHLDHDHSNGIARGFLCMKCNHGLGCFRDNPDFLRSAAEYLEAHALSKWVA